MPPHDALFANFCAGFLIGFALGLLLLTIYVAGPRTKRGGDCE